MKWYKKLMVLLILTPIVLNAQINVDRIDNSLAITSRSMDQINTGSIIYAISSIEGIEQNVAAEQ
ncbi:MAG: hypothetical protein R3275_07265, partial [Saprospiraceae bacterium]|nr:hypothetical protein [Saprospiraceae bacterium]